MFLQLNDNACISCGDVGLAANKQFCPNCGAQNSDAAKDFDLEINVEKYKSILSEFIFINNDEAINDISKKLRTTFKISWKNHKLILNNLVNKKKIIKEKFDFKLEFDENPIQAFAGHDTYLKFRFINKSQKEFYKFQLNWLDPETKGKIESQYKNFIKPGETVILGAKYIFERGGVKEISNLNIKVFNLFMEEEVFEASPLTFTVNSSDQLNFQQVNTTISGRVLDASNMAINNEASNLRSHVALWSELILNYALTLNEPDSLKVKKEKSQEESNKSTIENITGSTEPSPQLSWLWHAAESGDHEAQYVLGEMYLNGNELQKDIAKAINWLTKAANNKNAFAQYSLGSIYLNEQNSVKDNSKAFYWVNLSANNNHIDAQHMLGKMYLDGIGTKVDKDKALMFFEKSANSGHLFSNEYIDSEIKRIEKFVKIEKIEDEYLISKSKLDLIKERIKNIKPVDLSITTELSLEESIYGTKKIIKFPTYLKCTNCDGNYVEPKDQDQPCRTCNGSGNIKSSKDLEITFPAVRTDNGVKIRLVNQNEHQVYGVPPGDIYITANLAPHKYFSRNGLDLYANLNISNSFALNGGELEAPILSGAVLFVVPKNTIDGKQFRLKGKGISDPLSGAVGDLYFHINIVPN